MVQRTSNPRHKDWPNYGGRGIDLDPRWRDFGQFFADMGVRPEGMTLDRIDNDRGYWPENCRWADRSTQNRNKARAS